MNQGPQDSLLDKIKQMEIRSSVRCLSPPGQTTSINVNLEAPIQRVLEIIQNLKTKFRTDSDENGQLDEIVSILTSQDLFTIDVENVDDDTKNWIENQMARNHVVNKESSNMAKIPSLLCGEDSISTYASNTNLGFDIMRFAEISGGKPLFYLSSNIMRRNNLYEVLGVDEKIVHNFLGRIELDYQHLPYHNSIHAADVLKCTEMLLLDSALVSKFTKLEMVAMVLAAAIHDVDHPGVNNAFLIEVNHPLATMYNDLAVLESHHIAHCFQVARSAEYNIFAKLKPSQFLVVRKLMIQMVLATDLANHFQIINKFKGKVTAGSLKLEDAQDRQLVLEMTLKLGDLNNPTKPQEQAIKWTFAIMEEFFQQGDREREAGVPISMFMDRNDPSIPKCQTRFIDYLVKPCYEAWNSFHPTDRNKEFLDNMNKNRAMWVKYEENPSSMPEYKDRLFTRLDNTLDMPLIRLKFGEKHVTENKYWSFEGFDNFEEDRVSSVFGTGTRVSLSSSTQSPRPSIVIRAKTISDGPPSVPRTRRTSLSEEAKSKKGRSRAATVNSRPMFEIEPVPNTS